MNDYIIAGIVVLLVAVGIVYSVKHFKGKSGCCGSGGYKPKKKKLRSVAYKKTFKVDGMHCENCKNRIEEIVNDINGVAGKADLKKGELTVLYAENVDDELIKSRIQRCGYSVTDIN